MLVSRSHYRALKDAVEYRVFRYGSAKMDRHSEDRFVSLEDLKEEQRLMAEYKQKQT